MKECFTPSEDDKPKDAEIMPFRAGLDCSFSADRISTLSRLKKRAASKFDARNFPDMKSESNIIYNIGSGRLKRYGYESVSAIDQNEARQLLEMKKPGTGVFKTHETAEKGGFALC